MLLKLIKYEFKATSSRFLQLFGISILTSILTAILIPINIRNDNNYGVVSAIISFVIGLWILVTITVSILTLILIIHRFYNSMVGKGAYFTYCIPASAESLVASKLIVSVVWYILSLLVVVFGVALVILSASMTVVGSFDANAFAELQRFYAEMRSYKEGMEFLSIISGMTNIYIIFMAVSTIYGIIMWYFSAAVGMQAQKHKVGLMILSIIGISTFMQALSSVVMSADVFTFTMSANGFNGGYGEGIEAFKEFMNMQRIWIIKITVMSVILSIVGFFGTVYLVKRHPNVT